MIANHFSCIRFVKICIFLLFAFIIFPVSLVSAADNKKVLFICSYSESFISVPEQISGIKSVFDQNNISLDMEYMDMNRFNNQTNRDLFYQTIKYKLANSTPYDAILVGDDAALQFVMDYQEELFPDIPIVFLCINDEHRAKKAVLNPFMTGVMEITDSLRETIEIAIKFYPHAKKITAIVDDTMTGEGDKKQFMNEQSNFPELEFGFLNVSQYTFEEFGTILEAIENDTILIYMCMFNDKNNDFLDINAASEFISRHTNIPVFRHSIGGIGRGILGGKMVSFYDSGVLAANMVLDIFQGVSVSSIKMVTMSPDRYYFDYAIIKKYNLNEKLIPKDAVMANSTPSIWKTYQREIAAVTGCILLLFFLSATLFFDNIKRRNILKELKQVNDQIRVLNQKYENSISNMNGAVWEFDIKTGYFYFSDDIMHISDKITKNKGLLSDVLGDVFTLEEIEKLNKETTKYLDSLISEINVELSFINQSQTETWVLFRGKGVSDSEGNICMIHGAVLDISSMKEKEKHIEFFAFHDYLTKLPNRFAFMKTLEQELDAGNHGSVFLIDIDNFKSINDTLGHIYGDKILVKVSEKLRTLSNDHIFVSRHGGDEFLFLLTGIHEEQMIHEYAQKIIALFSEPFVIDGRENYISCSIGISNFPSDSTNMEQLIMNADTAMYKAKKDGKNSFMFYFADLNRELIDKIELEYIIRRAIKNNEFMLLYQPLVSTKTHETTGYEALLRLKNRTISPAAFIPLAEELGIIIDMGRWVTKEAIRQIAEWNKKGLLFKTISINFSSIQLKDHGYIAFLRDTLEQYQVAPELLEIEITESILLEKTEHTLNFLNDLKGVGISLALDDFGTGYSSLNYLTYIPIDKVKLDKSLIDKFLTNDNLQFMKSLISLLHELNVDITAEGIERAEQLFNLKNTSCDTIQGYLFSKPLPVSEAETVYNKIWKIT